MGQAGKRCTGQVISGCLVSHFMGDAQSSAFMNHMGTPPTLPPTLSKLSGTGWRGGGLLIQEESVQYNMALLEKISWAIQTMKENRANDSNSSGI